MKVKCVDNENGFYFLTVGKEYEVFKEESDAYKLQRDDNTFSFYHKSYFKIVEEDTDKNNNQDVTITLTKEEVNTLLVLVRNVGGTMKSPRKHAHSVSNKLGINVSHKDYNQLQERKLFCVEDQGFFFYEYPEEKSLKQLKIEELQGTIEEMKKQVEQLKREIL